MFRILLAWSIFFAAYTWLQRNIQPVVTQQGALAQMDDSYVGMIANQNAPSLITTIFFVLGLVLLVITINLIRRKKQL